MILNASFLFKEPCSSDCCCPRVVDAPLEGQVARQGGTDFPRRCPVQEGPSPISSRAQPRCPPAKHPDLPRRQPSAPGLCTATGSRCIQPAGTPPPPNSLWMFLPKETICACCGHERQLPQFVAKPVWARVAKRWHGIISSCRLKAAKQEESQM